jgi:hypothetical protein
VIPEPGEGVWYYRVRADDDDCWGESPWSNVQQIDLRSELNYRDDFDDPNSGWTTHSALSGLDGCEEEARQNLDYKYDIAYDSGRYRIYIPLDCRASSGGENGDTRHIYPLEFPPEIVRPTTKTCIEMRAKFVSNDPYWSFYGLAFAASADKSKIYTLEVNNLGDWAVVERTGYMYPGPNHPYENETRNDIVDWTNAERWPAVPLSWNTLRAKVEGDHVRLYINGEKVKSFSRDDIDALPHVGILAGDWEVTPTTIVIKYFYVDEGCDDW